MDNSFMGVPCGQALRCNLFLKERMQCAISKKDFHYDP
jgi:hypothetical protein